MKSVAFVFDGMGFGGIERIGIDYVRMCIESGYRVDVYNLNPSAHALVETLPEKAQYYTYRLSRKGCPETYSYGIQRWWWGKYAYSVISPIISLKQIVEKKLHKRKKYSIAIAISGHINDLSFVAKNYIFSEKKICWCHGNLISYLAICDAYSILYKRIDTLVTLSSVGEKDVYAGRKYLYNKHIVKIYNPTYITSKPIDEKKVQELNKKYGNFILMIARFEPGKGHDIAINVMKQLKNLGVEKNILFAGDGQQFNEIQHYSTEQEVGSNCIFLGNCYDIQNYIKASYINLLTSRWEGLPTAIIEAMTLGKPCVMTNNDDGEVSHGGEYCILKNIDDVIGIANALYELYTDNHTYQKYVSLSLTRAKDFAPETVCQQFIALLDNKKEA